MKQTASFVIALLTTFHVYGQEYPVLSVNRVVNSLSEFIPKTWTLKDSVWGDLNNDSIKDVVLVIQKNDSVFLKDNDELKTLPRFLLVVFKTKMGKLVLKDYNKRMLTIGNSPPTTYDDPYRSISIDNGVLSVDLFFDFINANFYGYKYKFRFQKSAFVLIGAETEYTTRRTFDFSRNSYNFLTKKWSKSTGNDATTPNVKSQTEWFILKLEKLKTLNDMGKPGSWEITTGEGI